MRLTLSPQALFILKTLREAGYEAYIVGGAVRDLLLQAGNAQAAPTTDYDFTTNAKPEEIQALFPESFYENTFGTVSITHEDLTLQMGGQLETPEPLTPIDTNRIIDIAQATKLHASFQAQAPNPEASAEPPTQQLFPEYQMTTFRSDEVYDDFRRPSSMTWGTSLEEDLERRDFTMNAMALQLESSPDQFRLIDPHHGQADLKAGIIRTVGEPEVRFQEDALRMMRAIRFSVQLNLEIDPATFDAIIAKADLIKHISWERIRDEFVKMLKSQYPAEAVELLEVGGLLSHILPELELTKGVEQGGHHTTDVWTHSLDALRNCPSPDPVVRLATLLHDIAKPQTQAFQNNTVTFYNHEIIGSRMAKGIAERLRFSRDDCQRVFTLVRYHMFHYQPHNTDAAIRRFMRKVGLNNVDDILDLREGDRLGSGARKTSWRLEEMKQRMIEQLHQPMAVTDLVINGTDLIQEFQLKPGPIIGQVLHELFEMVLDNPELNNREKLLEAARELIK